MLIKLLLLLAIGLKQATAICFRNESSNVKRGVVGRPKAVDDYHCKIICVEKTDCLTYIFPENECFLLGGPSYDADTTCTKAYYEWVKKTNDGDCQNVIDQPTIDDEYQPNPALPLATNATVPPTNQESPCPIGNTIMDTILPDKSHLVQGNSKSLLVRDGKLGSWKFFKQTDQNKTTYIRAAKCFAFNPTDFSDPASCGVDLPTMAIPADKQSAYEIIGPAKYALTVADMCSANQLLYVPDSRPVNGYVASSIRGLNCIDREWIMQSSTFTMKLSSGICVKAK